eukprot:scaffold105790_cov58-Phaeocystis_antarctica.AAC.6
MASLESDGRNCRMNMRFSLRTPSFGGSRMSAKQCWLQADVSYAVTRPTPAPAPARPRATRARPGQHGGSVWAAGPAAGIRNDGGDEGFEPGRGVGGGRHGAYLSRDRGGAAAKKHLSVVEDLGERHLDHRHIALRVRGRGAPVADVVIRWRVLRARVDIDGVDLGAARHLLQGTPPRGARVVDEAVLVHELVEVQVGP